MYSSGIVTRSAYTAAPWWEASARHPCSPARSVTVLNYLELEVLGVFYCLSAEKTLAHGL